MLQLQRFEKWLCAFVLIGAPLLGLIAGLLGKDFGDGYAEELAYITANNGRWLLNWYLLLPMAALMIAAVFILLILVRQRAPVLGYLGAAAAVLGLYFHGPIVGYAMVEAPLVQSTFAQDQVLTFSETLMYEHVAFTSLLIPFVGFFVGFILLGLSLWRARIVPPWIAALIIVAPLTEFIGALRTISPELMYALLLLAFSYIALTLLRSPGEVVPVARPALT
jgi:hypothetical protein